MLDPIQSAVHKRVNSGDFAVPLLPGVITEVMTLANDPDAPVRRLSDLIHQDPGLAAHVLRVANSPAFCPVGGVVSLQQAVSRLGMRLVRDITAAAVLSRSVFKEREGFPQFAELRDHSLATGLWARSVARLCRVSVESAFLAGLLNRVGAAVALGEAVRISREDGFELTPTALDRIIKDAELPLGVKVAQTWRMPLPVLAAIAYRPNPLAATRARHAVLITALASRMADVMAERTDLDDVADSDVVYALQLYPEDVDELLEESDTVRATMRSMSR